MQFNVPSSNKYSTHKPNIIHVLLKKINTNILVNVELINYCEHTQYTLPLRRGDLLYIAICHCISFGTDFFT